MKYRVEFEKKSVCYVDVNAEDPDDAIVTATDAILADPEEPFGSIGYDTDWFPTGKVEPVIQT